MVNNLENNGEYETFTHEQKEKFIEAAVKAGFTKEQAEFLRVRFTDVGFEFEVKTLL